MKNDRVILAAAGAELFLLLLGLAVTLALIFR